MLAGLALALCASLLVSLSQAAGPLPVLRHKNSLDHTGQGVRLSYNIQHDRRDQDAVFIPAFVKRELNGLLIKYAQAASLLHNVTGVMTPMVDDSQGGIESQLPLYPSSSGVVEHQTMELTDYSRDVLYSGPVAAGNPPQSLSLIPDTGSADLWFLSGCTACHSKQFFSAASITYGQTMSEFYVSYGDGYVSGVLAQDTVSVAALAIEHQYFGAVDQIASSFSSYPSSGVLGLGFGAISQTKTNTFFENLVRAQKVPSPLFSIALAPSTSGGHSELCLGCINEDKFTGDIAWLPLQSKTWWTLGMTGLAVNTVGVVPVGLVAAIDSGTSQIYVPMSAATAFYNQIPGSKSAPQYGEGFWTFPCNSRLNLTISFDAVPFDIDLSDFNLGKTTQSSTDCVGGVFGFPEELPSNFAVIGAGFLKSWYAIFDYSQNGRIGFAKSTARDIQGAPIPAGPGQFS